MRIKTSEEIFDKCLTLSKASVDMGCDDDFNLKNTREVLRKENWVDVYDINKRLSSVMNVRCDEKEMRKLIIDIQLEFQNKQWEE